MANAQSYSSKSTAIRGAKRAGIENPIAYESEGRWYIGDMETANEALGDNFEMSADELAAQVDRPKVEEETPIADDTTHAADALGYALSGMHAQVDKLTASTEGETAESRLRAAISDDFAGNKGVQAAAREIASTKSYKQVAYYGKSNLDKPVAFIHQFLSDNPGMTRKEAVIALTEGYGVNYSTARTQYQRWFTAQKAAK